MNVQNMADALRARDDGMASSQQHAEQDAPGWGERAYQAVKSNPGLKRYEGGFTMEVARAYCWGHGLDDPTSLRAWGAVTQRLLRDGIIEPVGYAKAASSHGSPKRTYRMVKP